MTFCRFALVCICLFATTAQAGDIVDWRTNGAVTPVKNQGRCGSSYAFAANGAIEGVNALKKGILVSLSEQQIVSCGQKYGNQGCNEGPTDSAFDYVKNNKGVQTEKSYPYTSGVAGDEGTCSYNPSDVGATITGWADVPSGDETALQNAVATVGPIAAVIDASHKSFQSYKGGIYSEPACSTTNLDQAVLIVGYGVDDATNKAYWIVKNSWGTDWGEQGYIRIAKDAGNMCGIATAASYPLE